MFMFSRLYTIVQWLWLLWLLWLFWLSFTMWYNASYNCANATDASQTECEALMQLATRSSVPATDFANRWDSNTVCSRNHITCSGNDINRVSLSSKSIDTLYADDLIWLSNLDFFSLGNSTLSTIQPWAFNGLTSVTRINLEINSNLSGTFGTWLFSWLSTLTAIGLSNNSITSIPSWAFIWLPNLLQIYLGNNDIDTLEQGSFGTLSNLTTLDLWHNSLSSIAPNSFEGLSSINVLQLDNNSFTEFDSSYRWGLSSSASINNLNLWNNPVTSIEAWDFDGLSTVNGLILNNTLLTSIENTDFNWLSSLVSLNFTNVPVASINSEDFANLPSTVTSINLWWPSMITIEAWSFDSVPNLEEFTLTDSSIVSLPEWLFDNNPEMTYFEISSNPDLATIPWALFSNLSNLTEVYFESNDVLTELPDLSPLFANDGELYLDSTPIDSFAQFARSQRDAMWLDLIYDIDLSSINMLLWNQPLFNAVSSVVVNAWDIVTVSLPYQNLNNTSAQSAGMIDYLWTRDHGTISSNASWNIEFYVKAFDDVKVDNEIVINVQ